jgi:tetratricopeptide (TPR) repeat protein
MGGLEPQPDAEGNPKFTFQQLLLLRTTRGLLEAGIPARRVRRVWSSLRRQLASDLPLTSVRILADGARAVAWDENASWQPDSGQFLLDFDAAEITGHADTPALTVVDAHAPRQEEGAESETPSPTAEQWFHLACELEDTSPLEARQAYLQSLALDPGLADAHLNLGRLDHEAGELGKAEMHYRRAVQSAPDDATAHFNLAVLLEDRDRPDEAIQAYAQAIARDPDGAADAHYNLGLLLEARGRRDEAMRHLMAARRLYEVASPRE